MTWKFTYWFSSMKICIQSLNIFVLTRIISLLRIYLKGLCHPRRMRANENKLEKVNPSLPVKIFVSKASWDVNYVLDTGNILEWHI